MNILTPVKIEPLYEKVKSQLLAYIDTEKPKLLPREKELIKLFNVSRNTVRHAVRDLNVAGILKPIQGRGTIVMKYSNEKPSDIGVVCTDALDVTDPWIAITLRTLRQAAYEENLHLNLFFCHDYTISTSNSSAYSYLMNSGKLGGLILLSALESKDVAFVEEVGIPFVTVDFQYASHDAPAFLFNIVKSIKTKIDEYVLKGARRFAMVAKKTRVLTENACLGQNGIVIENWETLLRNEGLPMSPCDFNMNITDQILKMYSLPSAERPEVVFTPFIPYIKEASEALAEFSDWNPIHVVTAIKGDEHETPCMLVDPVLHVQKAFKALLAAMVNN